MKVNWKDEKLIKNVVKKSFCYREVLRNLGLISKGGNNATLRKWIKYYNIDVSHFDPYKNIMEALKKNNTIPLAEILEGKHPDCNRYHFKKKLIAAGLKTNDCEVCGIHEIWNNEKLVMQLDHINGISNDNRLENLRMVCPNCHSQTKNFSGRNSRKQL